MTSWHDSEARQVLDARKRERDNEWLRRQVGDATYLRGLMILGYLPRDADWTLWKAAPWQPKKS